MANEEHLVLLRKGVNTWNEWRKENPEIRPDLTEARLIEADLIGANLMEADLAGADLAGADLTEARLIEARLSMTNLIEARLSKATLVGVHLIGARLIKANLFRANLFRADLTGANLSRTNLADADLGNAHLIEADLIKANLPNADLMGANLPNARLIGANLGWANLMGANLAGADLTEARLTGANLMRVDFSGANLTKAYLDRAQLVETNLENTNLEGCTIYGISAWSLKLAGAKQANLIITQDNEPVITVDDLEVAQFIYLLLNNQKIRAVIDTIGKKAVLILGRFTPERKAVLDSIREKLRRRNYLPILFDFEKPGSRDFTETASTLAHMARFIIADLTEPSSIPKELEAIVPTLAVPVQPLLEGSTRPYSMFRDYWKYHWVLAVHRYSGLEGLMTSLEEKVIAPAEAKARELAERRKAAEEALTEQ